GDNPSPEDERALMDRYALRDTRGIDLPRFVINPHSFGQTVENMFYVSFLIREGSVKLEFDSNGLPAIGTLAVARGPRRACSTHANTPVEPIRHNSSAEPTRSKTAMRHQAIMSIDMETWRDLIA